MNRALIFKGLVGLLGLTMLSACALPVASPVSGQVQGDLTDEQTMETATFSPLATPELPGKGTSSVPSGSTTSGESTPDPLHILEQAYQRQLEEQIQRIQEAYQRQLEQQLAEVRQEYEQQLQSELEQLRQEYEAQLRALQGAGTAKPTPALAPTVLSTAVPVPTVPPWPDIGPLRRIEFYGTVQFIPPGLIGTWIIDGRPVYTTQSTRFEQEHGFFAVGVRVEVKGYLQGEGAIWAEKIEIDD